LLAPFACDPAGSRGRRRPEPESARRNAFQRDRDRIVHSGAFRRLVYKTQVFLNHEGDLFRTRLTHSLEVAQIARSVARSLGLHEDLVEAISLAHDIGHAPFGHAGQDALQAALREHDPASGGFEHNVQSLRVVDRLEQRYPGFDGLNLCFETREGVLKHCSASLARRIEAQEPGGVGARFLAGTQPSLEAQLCNLADELAYNAHDIEDGIRSGLLSLVQVGEVPPFAASLAAVRREHPGLDERRLLFESGRRMLSRLVDDLTDATLARLQACSPRSVQEVREQAPLVGFSDAVAAEVRGLKRFLFHGLYRHPQVVDSTLRAKRVVRELFEAYAGGAPFPAPLPGPQRPSRAVADYIAGMTDRYAIREHHRLTGARLFD
jgi:dGTPase